MKVSLLAITIIVLVSCTSGIPLKSVDYETLFTDGNSKVWLINKVVFNGAIISPINNADKDVLIFYANGHANQIATKEIGRIVPLKAHFHLNSRGRLLQLEFKDFYSEYKLPYITEDSILLQPTSDSETKFSMQLIPFAEL